MKPDRVLLLGRIGRWQWPWALLGTVATFALVFVIGFATEPIENWIAGHYGEATAGADLTPGRLDTFAGFLLFAITVAFAPALAAIAVHGVGPGALLGTNGQFRWDLCARASLALILVMALGLLTGLVREPANHQWQASVPDRLPWIMLALPIIFFQSFAEEYFFKGYLLRLWGAVLPVRWLMVLIIAVIFTGGHAINDDVAQDLVFNLMVFFAGELLTLVIYLRTQCLGAVTGLHWINNVWSMCILANQPGQSPALALAVYTDPIISAGGSRLTDPYSYVEVAAGLALLWVLLTWRQSPLRVTQDAEQS